MSIKETLEVIKDAVNERISSPILGSFAFFFVGCNWKTGVILARTQMPIEVAIKMIEETRMTWFHGFILPAILTVFFCAAYPWIKYYLSWYTDWVDAKRIIKRHAVELLILQNRKEILGAEAELEEIRNARTHDAERRKLEFEHELQRRDKEMNYSEGRKRLDQEMSLELHRKRQEIEHEREMKMMRKKYDLDQQ